jgi:BirA family biotin operon repressor/biotin-[acetyl-CoA-carboxylase] ligase
MMSRLDAADVTRSLTALTAAKLTALDAFASIASTNSYLLAQPGPDAGCFRVAVADQQTAGRGRHDRRWISPPGSGLYLSLAYSFGAPPRQLSALTLALGVGIVRSLAALGIRDVQLKWPNDIVLADGKLGGILTEVHPSAKPGLTVVAGVGLNIAFSELLEYADGDEPALPATDLAAALNTLPERAQLAGTIVENLYDTMVRFEVQGLDEFAGDWRSLDWLAGRAVTVDMPDTRVHGTASGIDADGALIVERAEGPVRVVSGSIVVHSDARGST